MFRVKVSVALLLVVLTAFFVFQYHSVFVTDSLQATVMNQIRLMSVEYNSSDPLTITGTRTGGFFDCNFTIENLAENSVALLEIRSTFAREKDNSLYIVAEAAYSGEEKNLDVGNTTFTVRMHYTTVTELPSDMVTTPVFFVTISVKYGSSTRNISATVSGSTVSNEGGVTRTESDQTYSMLFTYSTLIMGTWILGIGAMLTVEFVKVEKTAAKVERLAGANFLLIAMFIFFILFIPMMPYPPPYRASSYIPASGGITGLQNILTIFLELTAASCIVTASGLFLNQRWAKILSWFTFALCALFIVSLAVLHDVLLPVFLTDLGRLVFFASLVMVAITTSLAVFRSVNPHNVRDASRSDSK